MQKALKVLNVIIVVVITAKKVLESVAYAR